MPIATNRKERKKSRTPSQLERMEDRNTDRRQHRGNGVETPISARDRKRAGLLRRGVGMGKPIGVAKYRVQGSGIIHDGMVSSKNHAQAPGGRREERDDDIVGLCLGEAEPKGAKIMFQSQMSQASATICCFGNCPSNGRCENLKRLLGLLMCLSLE